MTTNRQAIRIAGVTGAAALAFPVVYTTLFFEQAGELGPLVVLFAVYVTAMQVSVWAVLRRLTRSYTRITAAIGFAVGAWSSLGTTVLVFISTEHLVASFLTYVFSATSAVLGSRFVLDRTQIGPARQGKAAE